MGKEVIKTIRWWQDKDRLIKVYEVYSTDGSTKIKAFRRRKHARKFAKR